MRTDREIFRDLFDVIKSMKSLGRVDGFIMKKENFKKLVKDHGGNVLSDMICTVPMWRSSQLRRGSLGSGSPPRPSRQLEPRVTGTKNGPKMTRARAGTSPSRT